MIKNNQKKSLAILPPKAPRVETSLQRVDCVDWERIGATLIGAFTASIQRAERTRASYAANAAHLFHYLADVRAPRCSAFEVGQFYADLKARADNGQLKGATIAAYIQAAGRVIEWGRVQAQAADDMTGGLNAKQYAALFPGQPFADKPKVERFKGHKRAGLTTHETDAFLSYFEQKARGADSLTRTDRAARRNRCMMYLMNELGLRCVELVRLHLRDVQDERQNLRVGITHKGKTTPSMKYIDKSFKAAQYLAAWIDERRTIDKAGDNDFAFVSLSNRTPHSEKQLTTRTVENVCVEALKAIGVKCEMITTHSIRHSFATQALEAVPLDERMQAAREIQETMGHSSLNITLDNYAHDIDAKASRIRHIREAQRLERQTQGTTGKRGRPKGAKNKPKRRNAKRGQK